jgi:serine/threonine protein kinase
MHSLGVVHGDLRPKNFLVDEYGILKIADFKFSRKNPKVPLGDTHMDQRGVAAYMAPELFTPEGVHSYYSDFWGLGCALYELRRGIPPFGVEDFPSSSNSSGVVALRALIEKINNAEPISCPVNFADVSGQGLNKDRDGRDKTRSGSTPSKSKSIHANLQSVPPVTPELADLLLWLLEKSPLDRCDW